MRTTHPLLILTAVVAACGQATRGGNGDGSPDPDDPDGGPPSTRFETEPQSWDIAASGSVDGFNSTDEATTSRYWTTVDIDGDRLPDLVQTADALASQQVWDLAGSPYWKVFRNTGSGWSLTAQEWRVPDAFTTYGFYATAFVYFPGVAGSESYSWGTIDIDGDRTLDLVHAADPSTGTVWGALDQAHWKVYRGQEDGFAAVDVEWEVPPSGDTFGFRSLDGEALDWVTTDIDGDGKPDLVRTMDPATGYVFDATTAPHWKVHLNEGDGFARTPTTWSVPQSGEALGFYVANTSSADATTRRWSTFDIDGDGKPDLIHTADPATGGVWDETGAPHWKVFTNTGSGFAPDPAVWTVPASGILNGFFHAFVDVGQRHWGVFDINGDNLADLVQTGDVALTDRVWDATGVPHWKVFLNDGEGFSTTLYRWTVPVREGDAQGFYALHARRGWSTIDVDGDHRPDLVHTADPATSYVWDAAGSPYWQIFLGAP